MLDEFDRFKIAGESRDLICEFKDLQELLKIALETLESDFEYRMKRIRIEQLLRSYLATADSFLDELRCNTEKLIEGE